MNRVLLLSLILICLINTVIGQNFANFCSVYCSGCDNSKGTLRYAYCVPNGGDTCPKEFIASGDATDGYANCTADPDIYGFVEELRNQDFTFDPLPSLSSTSCSGFGNLSPAVGFYNHNIEVVIRKDTAVVDPHYAVRIIVGVLFINSWGSGDTINFTMSPSVMISLSRGGASGTELCNVSSGSNRQNYVKSDNNVVAHTLTAFNWTAKASRCNNCMSSCTCYWMVTDLLMALKLCDFSCTKCNGPNSTNCSECATGYLLSGTTCSDTCLPGYYENTTTTPHSCNLCDYSCSECTGAKTNCTVCNTNYVLFINSSTFHTCLTGCPTEDYYYSTSLGYCDACDYTCKKCTDIPSPCQSCHDGYYLYLGQCLDSCPVPYYADSSSNQCADCSVYCVNMTLSRFIPSGSGAAASLMFDFNFTHVIDWDTFSMSNFTSLVLGGSFSIDDFNVSYASVSSRAFRIIIIPYNYAFLVNQSVTVNVRSKPTDFNYTSNDLRPFMDSVFNQTLSVVWNYLKPPPMTSFETSVVTTLSSYSTSMNNALANPGVQEIKKFGFLFLILNSLQITSCLVLLNTILPQNLYEGIRFFASFIFFDVPPWQKESSNTKFVVSTPVALLPSRRLLSVQVDEFSFRRTGFSGVFIYDAYSQILLIVCCYAALGLSLLISRYYKRVNKIQKFILKCLNAFHQISVLYFTLTIVFEITYFNGSGVKWASIIICFIVNVYYLFYQMRIYYILLDFPSIPLNDPRFQQFIVKYSYYLKNIRFDEDTVYAGKWGIYKLWLRPHNYHILSYIKKFMMMLSFPIFYKFGFAQVVALVTIQFVEILRFIFTWPYIQKWRNVFRLTLEVILFAVFAFILFIEIIVINITKATAQNIQTWASFYYSIGWITFALICAYNVSFLLLFCLNWYQDCNQTNRQILEKSRREYYFEKLKQYQQNHDIVPIELVNECVKKGNLNKRKKKQLPEVLERVEYYGINPIDDGVEYNVDVKVITELAMGTEYNYSVLHNLVAKEMIDASSIIGEGNALYDTINRVYQKYKSKHVSHLVLKTFMEVDQKKYKFGETVPLQLSKLTQEVEVHYLNRSEPEIINIGHILHGFPISHAELEVGLGLREIFE